MLVLRFDQEGGSFIVALDKTTGTELWRANRDESSTWSMPLVVDYAGAQAGGGRARRNKVRSYDLKTGKLIWECAGLGVNAIPAPVRQDDVVYVMSGFRNPNLMAIRLGRTGDLTGHRRRAVVEQTRAIPTRRRPCFTTTSCIRSPTRAC